MWDKRASILDVHDGDSMTAMLDQGFGDTKTLKLRLLAVFAPELKKDRGGYETHAFAQQWLADRNNGSEWPFIVITARTSRSDVEQSTLGRYVGTVTTLDGTQNLNAAISEFVTVNGYPHGTGSATSLSRRLRFRSWFGLAA